MREFLTPTPAIDSDHPAVRDFVRAHDPGGSARERAVALNLAKKKR